jgi:hypothetical protein
MIPKPSLAFRIEKMRVPAALLLAFLQRTPAVRVGVATLEYVLESPMGAVIKAAAVSAAALGAVDSFAGATLYTLVTSTPSPDTVTEGSQIIAVAFGINPQTSSSPGSWIVTGSFPPGLSFGDPHGLGPVITSTGTCAFGTPALFGTPTMAGDYVMMLQAVENPATTTGPPNLTTNVFTFEVIVTSTVTPTPTPTPTPTSANAPAFTTQPISATVTGGTVALVAVATNSPTYQWSRSGSPVTGATGSILLIPSAVSGAGSYTCVASNSSGMATSSPATVALTSTNNIGRLVNISCRAKVGTGANILIAGFAVGGQGTSGQEPLLIRASGPALVPFGVAGTLPDPQLQLFSGSTSIGLNNGWAGDAAISRSASAVGAFAWSDPTSHDSALLESMAPGPVTAQISGQSNDTGVALAEVYDATPTGTYTPTSPRLVNISTRVQVGSGGNILIAGFVIGGTTSRTVLIRASGPALVPFGVTGTLPDPELQLFSGTTLLEADSGWGGNAQIAFTAASVGAFSWGASATPDSALLVTLPPGAYTAQVSGASGDTGVALIEVYEVP